MPNIKSAKKRVKLAKKGRESNVARKSELRTAIRAVREAIKAADKDTATRGLHLVHKLVDKAVHKNIIHKRAGSRYKSRLAKQLAHLTVAA